MRFDDLRLAEPILRAVHAEGYTIPTPIQAKAIPHVLEGRDVLACAQTGTGKTAAFALPILHRLGQLRPAGQPHPRTSRRRATGTHRTDGASAASRPIRVLILAPTRELAAQIDESFRTYGRHMTLRQVAIFGGVNQNPQARALRDGVDILVATPGRLLDLMQQGLVYLRHVGVLVLDEADRMLDMGFIRDIRRIVAKVPTQRQTLLFSATMPSDIRELAEAILREPVSVHVAAKSMAADTVEQSVYFVEAQLKPAMLAYFLSRNAVTRALVFTRTKHGADRVARHLARAGIPAEAIHGNKSQNARTRAMNQFKSGSPSVLVATDIAARGLDIDEISHVINYDVPNIPETYVHRIGRTGRAGASGLAVSFCDAGERSYLKGIERLIRKSIPVSPDRPRLVAEACPPAASHSEHEQTTASGQSSPRQRAGAGQHARSRQAAPAPRRRDSRSGMTLTHHSKARPRGLRHRSRRRAAASA
ncbi:MAG: DEAD/DEAH box helicase [Phycisphaerae bacterium]|nr:DEAD/DEAH box helicase [Phycisphaerae bacterium]